MDIFAVNQLGLKKSREVLDSTSGNLLKSFYFIHFYTLFLIKLYTYILVHSPGDNIMKLFSFSLTTSRKGFWLTYLGLIVLGIVAGMITGFFGALIGADETLVLVTALALSVPLSIAVLAAFVRRVRDTGVKNSWIIVLLGVAFCIPYIGSIPALLYAGVVPSNYFPRPKKA